MLQKNNRTSYSLKCDFCSKTHETENLENMDWRLVDAIRLPDTILFEKHEESGPSYETFELGQRETLAFCSLDCMTSRIRQQADIFSRGQFAPHKPANHRRME